MATLYFARVPFTYANQDLERGEILELKNTARDNQLRGLKYFLPFDPIEHSKHQCDGCGKIFCSEGFYLTHKRKPSCISPSAEITKAETAMLLEMDPLKVKVED